VATITSNGTGGGNPLTGATWAGGVAPVAGTDTAIIAAGDTLTVPAGATFDLGESGATGRLALTINRTGKLVIQAGGTVTMRGDIKIQGTGSEVDAIDVQGGGILQFTSANAVSPLSQHYRIYWAGTGVFGRFRTSGTLGNRAIVRTLGYGSSSGGAWIDANQGKSIFNCGNFHCVYTDFTDLCGASTTGAGWLAGFFVSGNTTETSFDNCTFTGCGDMEGYENFYIAGDFVHSNCTWINSRGGENIYFQFGAGTITGLRTIAGAVFDKRPYLGNVAALVADRAHFADSAIISCSESTTPAPLLNVFHRTNVGNQEGSITIGFKDSVLVYGAIGAGNPHGLGVPGTPYDLVNDGFVVEQIGDDPTQSDTFLYTQDSAAPQLNTFQNYIKLPNAVGTSTGNVANVGGVHRRFLFQHGTAHLGSNESGAGKEPGHILFDEFSGTHADMIVVRSCLVWDTVARSYVLSRNKTPPVVTPTTDVALVTNLHHNGRYLTDETGGVCDYSDGTSVVTPGYQGLKFSGAQATKPGAGDVVGVDPQFVDKTRCLSKWDHSLASTINAAVTGLSAAGGTDASFTFVGHQVEVGSWITIGGAVEAAFNVTARVTQVVGNVVHYSVTGAPTSATGSPVLVKRGTVVNAIAQFVKQNLAGFDSRYTVTAYLTYVRAGFAPQAAAYRGAAHDGTDIGAVAVAAATSVATSLAVSVQPNAIASGARHGTPVAVQVLDQYGAVFQETNRWIAAALVRVTGDTTAVPFGTSTRATVSGVTTYTDPFLLDGLGVVSMAGGTYKWRFTSYRTDAITGAVVGGTTIGPTDSNTIAVTADAHGFNAGALTIAKLLYPLPDSPTLDAAAILPKPGVGGYEQAFDYYRDIHWTAETTPPGNADGSQFDGFYYDAALVDYARAERCKVSDAARSAVMNTRGDTEAKWYRDQYVLPNNGKVVQNEMFFHGLAIHYLRTQDYASRLALELLGRWGWAGRSLADATANALTEMPIDVRPTVRAYQGFQFCTLLGIPDATAGTLVPGVYYGGGYAGAEPPPWSQALSFVRTRLLAYSANGQYPNSAYCGYNALFQIGLLAEAIIDDWYLSGLTTASVLPTLQRTADFLVTQWVSAEGGFHYLDGPCPAAGWPVVGVAADLTGLMVNVIAWVAWRTAGTTYRTTAADAVNKMVVNGYQPAHKQFNQLYRTSYKAVAYLALASPPGPSDHLTITTQPAGAVSGAPMTTQPAGAVVDIGGLTVAADASTVTALLVVESGAATPSGTLTAPVVSGLWAFTNLGVVSAAGATAHWHFTDGAVTAVDSATFTVTTSPTAWRARFRYRKGL
jgi:hypothetical protein